MSVFYWTIEGKEIAFDEILKKALTLHSASRKGLFLEILYTADHPLFNAYTRALNKFREALEELDVQLDNRTLNKSTQKVLSDEENQQCKKIINDAAELIKEDGDKWRKLERDLLDNGGKEFISEDEVNKMYKKQSEARKQCYDAKRIYSLVENHIEAIYGIYTKDKLTNV